MNTNVSEYELALLFSPSLSESDVKEVIEKFKGEKLKSISANVLFEDYWGKKVLAYPIKKETSAHYVILVFSCESNQILSLDEDIRLDKNIMRHLISKLDKDSHKITLAEREEWNTDNLPEKKKRGNEEKRAPFRGKKPAPKKVEVETKKPAPVQEKEEKKVQEEDKLDKAKLDKKLDEILEGDIDL